MHTIFIKMMKPNDNNFIILVKLQTKLVPFFFKSRQLIRIQKPCTLESSGRNSLGGNRAVLL